MKPMLDVHALIILGLSAVSASFALAGFVIAIRSLGGF